MLWFYDQLIIADTEDNLQRAVYLLYKVSKEYNLEIATGKTKVFGFVGTDHLTLQRGVTGTARIQ